MSILITGGTGFLGNHIIHELLSKQYSVVATTRTSEKADALRRKFNNSKLTTVVVEDPVHEDAYNAIFKSLGTEITGVIHTAFPLKIESSDFKKDIIDPAVEGMVNLLKAIERYGSDTVKDVVLTSGTLVMIDMNKVGKDGVKFNEESWCPSSDEYAQQNVFCALGVAKKLAEMEGWNFYKRQKQTSNIRFTSVLPSYIFGPQTFDTDVHEHLNISNEVINQSMHAKKIRDITPLQSEFVHAADVAKVHVLALERADLAGHRLVLSSGSFNNQDILNVLNEDFPSLRGKIPLGDPMAGIAKTQTDNRITENSATLELLGFSLKTLKQCVDDTAAQVLRVEERRE